ncbi:MAG: hypothetical protein WAK89_02910 [Candidatus Sulfotelmatobacter sp.]
MRSPGANTLLVIASLIVLDATAYCSPAQRTNDQKPGIPASLSLVQANSPIDFEINIGQFPPEARYVFRGPGYNLVLTSAEAIFEFGVGSSSEHFRLRLTGANPDVRIGGREPLPSYSNYLIGNDPHNWHKHVPQFGEVWYADIYSGIDLVYYGSDGQFEYDFVVAPHVNAEQIAFSIAGCPILRALREGWDSTNANIMGF